MAARQKQARSPRVSEDEIRRRMFEEYREENARDMEREALGGW